MDNVGDHLNSNVEKHDCFDEDSYAKLVLSIEEYQAILDEAWEAYG